MVPRVPERDCAGMASRSELARSWGARTIPNHSTGRTLLRLVCDPAAVRWLRLLLLFD
jgi:hypothetical protein